MTAPRIPGPGHAVPAATRGNDDPIFDWLKAHPRAGSDLFAGYRTRHVLAPGQGLTDIMQPAARMAMDAAGVTAAQIDMALDDASISAFNTPNAIGALHRRLGLPPICCRRWGTTGCAMRIMRRRNRRPPPMAPRPAWSGRRHRPRSGNMSTGRPSPTPAITARCPSPPHAPDRRPAAVAGRLRAVQPPVPFDHRKGVEGVAKFGVQSAPDAVKALLDRHGAAPGDTCLITHQARSTLMPHWKDVIKPGCYVETIASYANLAACSVPFNPS